MSQISKQKINSKSFSDYLSKIGLVFSSFLILGMISAVFLSSYDSEAVNEYSSASIVQPPVAVEEPAEFEDDGSVWACQNDDGDVDFVINLPFRPTKGLVLMSWMIEGKSTGSIFYDMVKDTSHEMIEYGASALPSPRAAFNNVALENGPFVIRGVWKGRESRVFNDDPGHVIPQRNDNFSIRVHVYKSKLGEGEWKTFSKKSNFFRLTSSGVAGSCDAAAHGAAEVADAGEAASVASGPASIFQIPGSGHVATQVRVTQPNNAVSQLKVEISVDGGPLFPAIISDATEGAGSIDNAASTQINDLATPATVTVVLDTSDIEGHPKDVIFYFTPVSKGYLGQRYETQPFAVDNLAPTLGTFSIASVGSSSLNLSWSKPLESNMSHYIIWYGESREAVLNQTSEARRVIVDDGNSIGTNLSKLRSETRYYVSLTAVDKYGSTSEALYTEANTAKLGDISDLHEAAEDDEQIFIIDGEESRNEEEEGVHGAAQAPEETPNCFVAECDQWQVEEFVREIQDNPEVSESMGLSASQEKAVEFALHLAASGYPYDLFDGEFNRLEVAWVSYAWLEFIGHVSEQDLDSIINEYSHSLYSDLSLDTRDGQVVHLLTMLGVINGYPDGTYRPQGTLNRAEGHQVAVETAALISEILADALVQAKAVMGDTADWFMPHAFVLDAFGEDTFYNYSEEIDYVVLGSIMEALVYLDQLHNILESVGVYNPFAL